MTFGDSNRPRPTASIRLTAAEFEVIFQVTKELRSLPKPIIEGAGWSHADVDHLLSLARGIRGRIEGVPFVHVRMSASDPDSGTLASPSISNAKYGNASVKEIVAVLPYRVGREWQRLAEAVVSSLGPRELFLRTGYQTDDVLVATRHLSIDVRDGQE